MNNEEIARCEDLVDSQSEKDLGRPPYMIHPSGLVAKVLIKALRSERERVKELETENAELVVKITQVIG